MKTAVETTNDIKIVETFKGTVYGEKCDIIAVVRIGGSCAKSNGHEDFSLTGTAYLSGKARNDRNMVCGGAMGDIISEIKPEYSIFNRLHLCDFNGVPMHASSNMRYHLKNGFNKNPINSDQFKPEYCKYYRVTPEQFDKLNKIKNLSEVYFSVMLERLGVLDQWREEAKEALKIISEKSGKTFKTEYPEHIHKVKVKPEDREEIERKEKEGYYTPEAIKDREEKRLKDLNKAMIDKVNADFNKKVVKYQKERDICLELIKQGFEIDPRTGNIKGAIYYNHTNELNFNWSTEKIEERAILDLINNIDKSKFSGLKISNDKKELATI